MPEISREAEVVVKLDDAINAICYPLPSTDHCAKLISELRSHGILYFISYGELRQGKFKLLGRGWASNVFLAEDHSGRIVAVKALRPDSRRRTMLWEGVVLLVASSLGISPKVYVVTRFFIAMEPILGPKLSDYTPRSRWEGLLVIRRLLLKAHLLDITGIRHNELARPGAQVLLDDSVSPPEPYIIDFDSATLSSRPGNLAQIVGGLHGVKWVKTIIPTLAPTSSELRAVLRQHKRSPSLKLFEEVLKLLEQCG